MMNSKAFQVFTISELENEIMKTKAMDFNPTLAIVFGSIDCNLEELPNVFSKHNIDVIGCSSSGEICNEEVDEKSLSVMLMDLEKEFYTVQCIENTTENPMEVGKKVGKMGNLFCSKPAFLMFFGIHTAAEEIFSGISSQTWKGTNVFGGMAADNFGRMKVITFCNEGVYDDALVTLILDENKVAVGGQALCGWEPIGAKNTITHAENNVIYTINDKPALEAFEDYFGTVHHNTETVVDISAGIAQYPLQILKGNSTVLRAALTVNEEDGSMMMAGPVKTGDQFKFSVAPGFQIIEETLQGFENYKPRFEEADAMILVSCKARHMSLGPLIEEEVQGIQNMWNKPMIGFFSFGEVGLGIDDECNFYNETCSLFLMKKR